MRDFAPQQRRKTVGCNVEVATFDLRVLLIAPQRREVLHGSLSDVLV